MTETDGVPPETRYTRSGDVNIAYQVAGVGPFDLVYGGKQRDASTKSAVGGVSRAS